MFEADWGGKQEYVLATKLLRTDPRWQGCGFGRLVVVDKYLALILMRFYLACRKAIKLT